MFDQGLNPPDSYRCYFLAIYCIFVFMMDYELNAYCRWMVC